MAFLTDSLPLKVTHVMKKGGDRRADRRHSCFFFGAGANLARGRLRAIEHVAGWRHDRAFLLGRTGWGQTFGRCGTGRCWYTP